MSILDKVIEAINSGQDVASIIKGLFGKKLSSDERWYISELLRGYEHEKQTNELRQEYRTGTERIESAIKGVNESIRGSEIATRELYSKIEGLVEGIIVGRRE